jgi:hypothetical protein
MTTVVESIQVFRKLIDSGPSKDWPETDQATAERMMGNLRCFRSAYSNGEWYVAIGYGRVVWHETEGDRWFVSPWFTSNLSRETTP